MLKNCQVRCKQIQEQISKSLPMTCECTEDLKWLNSVHLWLVPKEKSSYLKLCIHNGYLVQITYKYQIREIMYFHFLLFD